MKKQGLWLIGAILAVTAALTAILGELGRLAAPALSPAAVRSPTGLILDAGHGGEDGGAISITGVSESQINLEIVLKMDDILGFYGTAPLLLRREDISLHDGSAVTLREKKASDLKNRAAAIQAAEGASLISIHQNTYSQSRYCGAQTFYAPTQGSQELAEQIQAALRQSIQPENRRKVKQIPDTVYLMNHISCRAVLVECGFLTNPEEEALLRDDAYQRKLAAVIAGAWLTAANEGNGTSLYISGGN